MTRFEHRFNDRRKLLKKKRNRRKRNHLHCLSDDPVTEDRSTYHRRYRQILVCRTTDGHTWTTTNFNFKKTKKNPLFFTFFYPISSQADGYNHIKYTDDRYEVNMIVRQSF